MTASPRAVKIGDTLPFAAKYRGRAKVGKLIIP